MAVEIERHGICVRVSQRAGLSVQISAHGINAVYSSCGSLSSMIDVNVKLGAEVVIAS